jgi:protein-tyrosine phosphatase
MHDYLNSRYLNNRNITFSFISNFRDLGGYRSKNGDVVAWRHIFRSGALDRMTQNDFDFLSKELGVTSVIDLRCDSEIKKDGLGLLTNSQIYHHHISLIPDAGDRKANIERYKGFPDMGHYYAHLVQKPDVGEKVVKALEIIAEPANHPLVFHCSGGKDRTGVLSIILLSILGVPDDDIEADYCLSAPSVELIYNRIRSDPQFSLEIRVLPDYVWRVIPQTVTIFLALIRTQYGSARDYIEAQGANHSLANRLEKTLLVKQCL